MSKKNKRKTNQGQRVPNPKPTPRPTPSEPMVIGAENPPRKPVRGYSTSARIIGMMFLYAFAAFVIIALAAILMNAR